MAFDLTGLSNYVNESKSDLIAKILFVDGTLNEVSLMSGVKGPTNINLFDTDAIFQDGDGCSFLSSGSTALSNRTITPATLKVQESLCSKDLQAKYQVENLRPGANSSEIPFEEMYVDTKIKKIQQGISNLAWNGVAGANNVDGWIVQIEGDSDVVDITGATFSASNIIAEVDSMISGMDENIAGEDDLKIYMSIGNFNTLHKALRDANLFAYNVLQEGKELKMSYPSAIPVQVVGVKDVPASVAILSPSSNLVRSVDLLSDEDEVFMTIDDRERTADFQSFFTIGFNHAYGEQIVRLTTASL